MKSFSFHGIFSFLSAIIFLLNSQLARADATASGQLSFGNLSIVPTAGTFQWLTNWQGAAFAQATLSQQYNSGTAPTASAVGDFSQANGGADSVAGTGLGNSSASILGQTASDQATGQGWLVGWFMIAGGSGAVNAVFSAQENGALSVQTDANGQSASVETVFSMEIDGNPVLFDDQLLSIGASDNQSSNFSNFLSNTNGLQFGTVYELFVQADSEVQVSNVPEPGVMSFFVVGALLFIWAGRKIIFRRTHKIFFAMGIIFAGTIGISNAMYIGGDAPDVCTKCGFPPTREPGGTVATSLTEGNQQENYPVVALQSGIGPTLQFSLTYNSYNADGSRAPIDSGVGLGWSHSYDIFLFQQRGSFFRMGADGRVTLYHLGSHGSYTTDTGYFETLNPQSDGSYIVTNKLQSWWRFASIPNT